MPGKCLIFSAPSGSGKSTIVNSLLEHPELKMVFSISATNRSPRGQERDGVEYFFLTTDEFKKRIANDDFLEYEEVYSGCFYGTLKDQVEAQLKKGYNVVFDVDVVGGCNIKKYFGDRALSIFIQPPSVKELRERLIHRGTDTPEMIEKRVSKAEKELEYASKFDVVIINDDLTKAEAAAISIVQQFFDVK